MKKAEFPEVLLIDGYNLLGQDIATEGNLSLRRERLIRRMSDLAQTGNYKVLIVFDAQVQGKPWIQIMRQYGISVLYTKQNQTADQFIVTWIRKRPRTSPVRVITKDRALANAVQKLKVRVWPDLSRVEEKIAQSQGLLSRISANPLLGETLSKKSFDELRKVVKKT